GDFFFRMDVGSYINIYADVDVLELRINERAYPRPTYTSGERTGCNWESIANSQRSVFVVKHTNLRLLQNFGVRVRHEQRERDTGNRDEEIVPVERTDFYRRSGASASNR